MRWTVAAVFLALLLTAKHRAAAESNVIRLSCEGTTTHDDTNKVEPVQKMGVVVNLDERTVSFLGYVVPSDSITVDAAIITFEYTTKNYDTGFESHISGDIDRITGDMDAPVITFNDEKPLSELKDTLYQVHCKATDRTEHRAVAEPQVIALSCEGTTTDDGSTNKVEQLLKMGVVVNFDERTVSFRGYVVPTINVNPATISFDGQQNKEWHGYGSEDHISGLIDRATGGMHAQVIARPLYNDNLAPSSTLYHVHCKATDRAL